MRVIQIPNEYTILKNAIYDFFRGATHSTVASANGGLDMTMPGDIVMGDGLSYYGKNLTAAVERGDVPEERVRMNLIINKIKEKKQKKNSNNNSILLGH